MDRYAALIIDLKKSRDYAAPDRVEIQNYIKKIIYALNELFHYSIKFEVVFSGGDEVQGLFKSPGAAYLYFRLFNMLVLPVDIRAGIGVGEWDIKIRGSVSTEQDGPVYHCARFAIECIKDSLGYSVLLCSNTENDIYINSAINAATLLINNQSRYQNELSILTEILYPIIMHNAFDVKKLFLIKKLIPIKNNKKYFSRQKAAKQNIQYPFNVIDLDNIESFIIDAAEEISDLYVSSGKIKGLPGELSKILGTSRQSIEKSIKSANIYQSRNLTITALKLIEKI